MRRYAVIVGCQYPKLQNKLVGSMRNASDIGVLLNSRFGFSNDRMTILHNTDPTDLPKQPTGDNIRNAINNMVDQCGAGDLLFFYFSGHGGLHPANNGFPEEEYIVPSDHNIITSQEFRGWVDRLPARASFIMVSDSCHSGGLIGQEKEQIGAPSSTSRSHGSRRPGFLPLESSIDHLSSLSNINSPRVGDHLVRLFGNRVSPRFSRSPQPYVPRPIKPDNGILLSACMPHELATFKTGYPAFGLFTNALDKAVREKEFNITNRQLVMRTRELVHPQNHPQHPCLYCSDKNVDKLFLFQSNLLAYTYKN